jgi:hypothetical protein
MATELKGFFGGLLGKAESAIKGRGKQLQEQEDEIMSSSEKDTRERKRKNEQAADGKTRLTTDDKKY